MLTRAFVLGALTCKTAYFIAPALWKSEVRCSWLRSVMLEFLLRHTGRIFVKTETVTHILKG